MDALRQRHTDLPKTFMLTGLLLDVVLSTSQVSVLRKMRRRILGTPIGFAAVRVTREKSLRVRDIPGHEAAAIHVACDCLRLSRMHMGEFEKFVAT